MNSLIRSSMALAHRLHGAINHRRKYTDEPYTVHLRAVADLVEKAGGTPEMVAAAWLHDSIEDTDATFESVCSEVGTHVAVLVRELTDVSAPEDGNRSARKSIDRAHLAMASREAQTIKLADLIDNAISIQEHDPRFAQTFMKEKKLLLDVLVDGDSRLLAEAQAIVNRYFGN